MQYIEDYEFEDIERLAFDSTVPAHCTSCGKQVCMAEPDASWEGGEGKQNCHSCGAGTKIKSILIIKGFM